MTESSAQNQTPESWPRATVVVCTRERADSLRRCLESLARLDYPDYEIIVVDNAPTTEATRAVAAEFKVKYIVEPLRGLSRGRNRGLRESRGEIVAFADDDCRVEANWLKELAREFSDESVACATGPVRDADVVTETQQTLEHFSRRHQQGAERLVFCRDDPEWFFAIHSLKAGSGANMSLRKSFYDEHGGFDEAIGARTPVAGGMENGLFFMVLKHGGKLVHTPSAVVFHHEPAEMSDLRRKLMEGMTAQTAYLTKLLVTERGFRGRTLKLALRQCGKYFRAAAREGGQTGASSPLSLLDELWALARGPWRYLTCRRQVAKMRGKNCRGVFVKRRDIMTKPFLPFFAPDIGPEEIHEVTETLKSGWLTTGPRTKQFEQDFAKYIGCKHAIAVNSCTAALHLALDAIGLQPGDEVIVPTMTFAATAEVVCYFRAKPVFVDCEPDTQNIDARLIEEKITPRTKAIIPVHFGGLPCDMDAIRAVAAKHGLKVIEDAAHALPARYNGKLVGTIGDLTAFSFYANKTITTGEGGMLTTDDDALAERARVMSLHGISKDAWKRFSAAGSWYYEIIRPGFKYNLTDIASALGLCQLRKCDVMNEGRRRVARLYAEGLKSVAEVELLVERKGRESAWHLFVLRLKLERLRIDRAEFFEQMKAAGIGCSVHYVPLHMHPYYRETFSYRREDFPVASAVSERVITLPLFSKMTDSDVARVVEAVTTICRENGK